MRSAEEWTMTVQQGSGLVSTTHLEFPISRWRIVRSVWERWRKQWWWICPMLLGSSALCLAAMLWSRVNPL